MTRLKRNTLNLLREITRRRSRVRAPLLAGFVFFVKEGMVGQASRDVDRRDAIGAVASLIPTGSIPRVKPRLIQAARRGLDGLLRDAGRTSKERAIQTDESVTVAGVLGIAQEVRHNIT